MTNFAKSFLIFEQNKIYENHLPAAILMKYALLFLKKQQNLKLSSSANYRWRFMGQFIPIIWRSV